MDNYDINKQIDNVIKNLNTILSESNLPIGVAYYLIKDVYNKNVTSDIKKQLMFITMLNINIYNILIIITKSMLKNMK